jgi:hypothetical protein
MCDGSQFLNINYTKHCRRQSGTDTLSPIVPPLLLTDIHLNATLYQEDKRWKPGNLQTTRCPVWYRGALDTKLIPHVFFQFVKFHTGWRFARGPMRRRKVRAMPSVTQRPRSTRDKAMVAMECAECVSNLNQREAVRPDCPCCLRCR